MIEGHGVDNYGCVKLVKVYLSICALTRYSRVHLDLFVAIHVTQ